jgi:hypothetical protein
MVEKGKEDSSVEQSLVVLRGAEIPPDAEYQPERPMFSESNFEFTSSERKNSPRYISVFVEGLTTHEQVCELVGNKKSYRVSGFLSVSEIYQIKRNEPYEGFPLSLEVLWKQALTDLGEQDTRDGADGHAGIFGLDTPEGKGEQVKLARRSIRRALALLANKNCKIVKPSI